MRLRAAGDEGRKLALGPALRDMLLMLRPAAILLRVARPTIGLIARRIGLLLIGLRRRHVGLRPGIGLAAHGMPGILVAVVGVLALFAHAFRPVVRIGLAELLLRRRDQAEVMLGVLKVVFRPHRIAGGRGVTRQLNVFLGNV